MVERRAYLLDVTDRRPNDALVQELVDVLARYSYNEFYWYGGADAPLVMRLPARMIAGRETQSGCHM